ncbi:shikimate dehydrogenase [Neptunicoccus cionae]|uniref:Shikimate dehydrogenase (NADP(+)) n=1 Tax=Neptunicoccus cionae TaxID=2035344 RepID=A0A916VQ70_9RHOB|nr:shikimate dehydrogenase [Amylibacter cionae]GGA18721.1 shikimate dehydrogenase (NADP(+)) [Amylibacter cionae]
MKNPRVPLAGVIGWPISHSKSPRIHGYWLAQHDIAGHYVPLGIEPADFEEMIQQLPKLGFVGANVTIPHKETALELAAEVTPRAKMIGAANTLEFLPDGGFRADNTDGIGFINNLRQNAPDWDAGKGPALVLGAGGAGRAVLWSLLDAGVPKILLANRTRGRAEALADEFGPKISVLGWDDISEATREAALVVNTTSLGMRDQPPLDITLNCAAGALVTDLVYVPMTTDLLQQAQDKGLQTVDGLGMLLHQAVPGFEAWFGVRPQVTETLREVVLK